MPVNLTRRKPKFPQRPYFQVILVGLASKCRRDQFTGDQFYVTEDESV
jgi:hypothetical protein